MHGRPTKSEQSLQTSSGGLLTTMKQFLVIVAVLGLSVATPVHVGHVATQYHAQDELGQYTYGYAGGPSAKHETRTLDGVTRGGYSYVDAHGLIQSAQYVSDPHNGFRVAATNLPVGPAVPAKPAVVATAPVVAAVAPAVVATPAVVAAPAVAAAPAVVATPAVVAGLPEVVAARTGLFSHGLVGAHSWSGIVHALKKRSLAVVPTYTNYPGSTAPLVHAAPAVVAHSAVYPTALTHHWTGLVHALKKRSVYALASPYVAHGVVAAGPLEHPHVAVAKTAHLLQHHNEAVRNVYGVGAAPLYSPADAPDVAVTKHAHLLQQVHEAVRNTHGYHGLHGLVKRHAVFAAAPLALATPVVHSAVVSHAPVFTTVTAHHAVLPLAHW